MTKLKTLLQQNKVYYIILICAFIYSFISVYLVPKESLYQNEETKFKVQIMDIYVDGNYLRLLIKGKEKLQGTYYFKSLEEKKAFLVEYHLGDTILVEGNLVEPRSRSNPNGFDYKNYLRNEGIFYLLEIEKYQHVHATKNILYWLKNKMIERIDKIEWSRAYIQAFIIGDNSMISRETNQIYQAIGVSHLFAISGMHVALLTSILLWSLNKIHLNETAIIWIVGIFLLFYMFVTNFSPSIMRASLWFVLLYLNKIWKLNIASNNIYLLVIAIIIIINPFVIFKISFLFSAVISGFLILFRSWIKNQKSYLSKLCITSFVAFLVGMPICLFNFYQINILSIVYNLFFVPWMSFVLFPLALLTYLLPFLDRILYFMIMIMERVASICDLIPSMIIFKKPSLFICLLYYILIIYLLHKKNKKSILFLLMLFGIHYHYNHIVNRDYMIVLDVGQGDCILLHSNNKSILIDTGGMVSYEKESWAIRRNRSNLADSTIIPVLKSLGIRKLDYLILTHGDYDHLGEGINIIHKIKVSRVLFNEGEFNHNEIMIISSLNKEKIPYDILAQKCQLTVGNFQLLSLNSNLENENDSSIVLRASINNTNILLMGDASIKSEQQILRNSDVGSIDILKVGHHGSNTSTSDLLLTSVKPSIAVISAGENNKFGHPHQVVLERLKAYDIDIYNTIENGAIMFEFKKRVTISTFCP